MTKKTDLSRNDFVKVSVGVLGTVIGVTVAVPAVVYSLSPAVDSMASGSEETWIPAGKLEDYPIGMPTLFSFTRTKVNGWERTTISYGVYVLRENEIDTLCLSNICTHLSCRVNWVETDQLYKCPCHDAAFTKDGLVADGPPPRPLDEYATKVEDGILFFNFVEG